MNYNSGNGDRGDHGDRGELKRKPLTMRDPWINPDMGGSLAEVLAGLLSMIANEGNAAKGILAAFDKHAYRPDFAAARALIGAFKGHVDTTSAHIDDLKAKHGPLFADSLRRVVATAEVIANLIDHRKNAADGTARIDAIVLREQRLSEAAEAIKRRSDVIVFLYKKARQVEELDAAFRHARRTIRQYEADMEAAGVGYRGFPHEDPPYEDNGGLTFEDLTIENLTKYLTVEVVAPGEAERIRYLRLLAEEKNGYFEKWFDKWARR